MKYTAEIILLFIFNFSFYNIESIINFKRKIEYKDENMKNTLKNSI